MIIKYWYKSNGKAPAERFLGKLDNNEREKVEDFIEAYQNPHYYLKRMIDAGILKHLEGGLYNLKIKTCGSFFRFPSAVEERNIIILLDGFKKKTNRLERKDIDRVKKLYKEYKDSK